MEFNLQDQYLGETSGTHVIDGLEDIRETSLHMVQQAKRELLIRAQTLKHGIYDQEAFVEAVKQLAIRNARTRIRVLVTDIEPIKKNGHRLVQLGQRLSSSIEFRVGATDWAHDTRSFILVDECGYVLRPRSYDLHDATMDFNDRNKVRKLKDFFTEVWEHSEADTNLRQISL